ncbi:MAG: hypothetical protein ACLSTO_06810 [Bilophila wadsworthia]
MNLASIWRPPWSGVALVFVGCAGLYSRWNLLYLHFVWLTLSRTFDIEHQEGRCMRDVR